MYVVLYKDGIYQSFDAATSSIEFISVMISERGWKYVETRSYR